MHDLENKIWYRLIKVIYIGAYILTTLLILGIFVGSLFENGFRIPDLATSYIECTDHSTYKLGENRLDLIDAKLIDIYDQDARLLCAHKARQDLLPPPSPSGLHIIYNPEFPTILTKNYNLYVAYKMNPLTLIGIPFLFLSLVSTWLFFKIVEVIFFYVIIGKVPSIMRKKKIG